MRRNISILLGLFTALTASTMAEVELLNEDFSDVTFHTGITRDDTGWGIRSESNWAITDNALTGWGQPAIGEGACGYIIPLAASGITNENALTLSFDYTTADSNETIFVHIWGLQENDVPSTSTTPIMNTGAQAGSVWDQTGAPFDLYNMGQPNGEWIHSSIGWFDYAAAIVTNSGSYLNTFDISGFAPGKSSLDQYDYIAVAVCRNQGNPDSGFTTVDNLILTADTVAISTVAIIDPTELVMDMIAPATVATGTVDFVYNSETNLDVTITFSEETHEGAFAVVPAPPLTFTNRTTALDFVIDNATAGLASGETATSLVTFAWVETGGGTNGTITMPISSTFGFAAGQTNLFTGTVSTEWDNVGNWDLARVPGALGADLALIESAATANVVSNFTGLYAWETVVRGAATLNIGADLLGGGAFTVGGDAESGFVNQTVGSVSVVALNIGDVASASNSVYTLSGGTLTSSAHGKLYDNSQMIINGGTLTYDTDDNNDMTINGDGLLKLESGDWTSTGDAAGDLLIINANVEVSGGTVDLNGQNRFTKEFKIIGDAASISIDRVSIPPANFLFEFAPGGGSALSAPHCSYISFKEASMITVDGSNYTGGSGEITLFTGNINGVSSSPESVYVTTNFADGVIATITVDKDTNIAVLMISLGGFDDWIADFGLSGDDLLPGADVEPDGLDNLMEYALGGNPTIDDASEVSPKTYTADDMGTDYFYHVSDQRTGDDSLTITLGSETMLTGTPSWDTNDVSFVGESIVTNNYKTVTNRTEATSNAKFIKLEVQQN